MSRLITFLRAEGVVHYQGGGITLTLLLERPPQLEPEAPAQPRERAEPRVGKDGLTRAQQEEVYGSAMSDTAF